MTLFQKSILLYIFLLVIFIRQAKSQELSASELREIVDLYKQENFDPMKEILSSKHFYATKTISEYTADGNKYKDVYEFKRDAFEVQYQGGGKSFNVEDQLTFETIDRGFYKYFYIKFKLYCELCNDEFNNDMTWHYKNLENLKISKDTKSAIVHEVEFFQNDSLWAEDIKEPSRLDFKYYMTSINYKSTNFDASWGYVTPFYCFTGTYNIDIPYSPIDCSTDEYFRRIKTKQKINIPIQQKDGSYYIIIDVGGILVRYIIDSGASDVTITPNTEAFLLDKKIISSANYLTPTKYRLADGTVKEYRRIKLPWITVKGVMVKNVIAAISDSNSTPLLGKSFFDKFSYWKINNGNSTIELQQK